MPIPQTISAKRVVLVADVRLYREGLAAALPRDRVVVSGTASTGAEAATLARRLALDVVIIDIALPGSFDLIRELRSDLPALPILAFGVEEEITAIVRCAEAGAAGYVSTQASMDDLVVAIENVADGELRCPPQVAAELFRRLGEHAKVDVRSPAQEPSITAREREVLALLRRNLSNKEIASELNISEATVKNHVHNLLDKLQVTSRTKAATCLPRPNRTALRSRLSIEPASRTGTRGD